MVSIYADGVCQIANAEDILGGMVAKSVKSLRYRSSRSTIETQCETRRASYAKSGIHKSACRRKPEGEHGGAFYQAWLDHDASHNAFLTQCEIHQGLPFEIRLPRYNASTEAAFEEAEAMLASGNYKRYSSTDEMFDDILAGDDEDV